MIQQNKIFKIQTAFYKLICQILKDEKIEIFKVLKGSLPEQFIFIESVKEEFLQGMCSQFIISIQFISESSKILELSGFMENIKFSLTKNDLENLLNEEIINLKLLKNQVSNSLYSSKLEGKMEYILFF